MPTHVAAQVDLVLNVTDTPDPIPRTGAITYRVIIENNGITTATGVSYALTVPANMRYDGFTPGRGQSCTGMTVNQAGPGVVTCTNPNLAFTQADTFTVRLRPQVTGTAVVNSEVSSTEPDADPSNNDIENTTTVTTGADVRMTLTAPATLASGSLFAWTLRVINDGPDAATNQRVTIPLPSGITLGTLPAGCSFAGAPTNQIRCDVNGPIASGTTFLVGDINARIVAGSVSTVTASGSVAIRPGAPSTTPADPNTDNNTANSSINVTAGSDVRISMARSGTSPYFVGASLTFTLSAAYDGDVPTGLTIVDTIPTQYTIGALAATQNGWSCSRSGQIVTCTRPSGGVAGANQSLGSIAIPVTVNTTGTAVINRAHIEATAPTDPQLANNVASDGGANLLLPTADLAISKTGPNPALAVIGLPFAWTVAVSNGGPAAYVGDLIVTDSVPAGITVDSVSASGWSCSPSTPITGDGVLTCTRSYAPGGPLASGANTPSIVLWSTATQAGLLTNVAAVATANTTITDPNLNNNRTTSSVTASTNPNSADISVVKTVDLNTVPAGDVLTYQIEVINSGASSANSITLTDVFPSLINTNVGPNAGYVGETIIRTGGTDITCGNSIVGGNRQLTCTIPTLPVCMTGSCPLIEVAIRPGGNGGTRTNSATAISSVTADPNLSNNTGTVSSTIEPRADVTITKVDTPDPANAGQNLTYTIAAINNGPSQALGVTVTDTLPLDVFFVSASPSAGSCSLTPTPNSVTTLTNRIVVCNLTTINNAAQRTLQIVVRPTNITRGNTLTNVAHVATSTIEPSPGDANNSATATTFVSAPSLDLLVNNTDTVDPLTIGLQTVYNIVINNVGPSDAENVVLTDSLPLAGITYQSFAASQGSCATVPAPGSTGGVLVCQLGRINNGQSATVNITAQGAVKGVYTNIARITSDEIDGGFDLLAGNNRAIQPTTVRTRADLEIVTKTATPNPAGLRRPFTWTIRLRNNAGAGLTEADSVRVTDNLPSGMVLTGNPTAALVQGTVSENSCTGATGETTFTCTFGTLSSDGIVDITVPVRQLTFPSGGTITNTATAFTSSQDVVPGNNSRGGTQTIVASSIAGTVFRDFNNSGTITTGDTGIDGVGLSLSGTAFDATPITRNALTAGGGLFSFANLPEGTYTITRGTVNETYLTVGIQTEGTSGGNASTPPTISAIALGENIAATSYLFAFVPQPRIGVFKSVVGTPTVNANGSLTAVLRIGVRNFALEALNAVSITDPLSGAAPLFGTFVAGGSTAVLTAGRYTIESAPATVGSCTGATPTAAFNGAASTQVAAITSLASGVTCQFDFTLRYQPTVPLPAGNYLNQATGSGTGALSNTVVTDLSQDGTNPDPNGDGNPGDNNVPTPLGAILAADVTTVVTLPPIIAAGNTVNGTILYRNLGPYDALGVAYTLTMTTGLTNVSFGNLPAGAVASYDAGTGTVTLTGMPTTLTSGQIASGNGSSPITVQYTQNGVANSTVSSTIATTSNEGANTGPNSSSATVVGAFVADVTTSITLPATINAGSIVNGTVLFRNTGPSQAAGMTYSITMTTGLTNVSFGNLPATATATYNPANGVVTLTNMPTTLVAGGIASGNGTSGITVSYTQNGVANSTVNSTIGTTTDQGANVNPDNATATVTGNLVADVTTALNFPTTVNAGDPVTGTILFRNTGPSIASGVTYQMTLTPNLVGVTFGNLPAGATFIYTPSTGVVTFGGMPPTLAVGQIASGNGTTGITLSYTQPGAGVSIITSQIGTTTDQGANVNPDAATASPGGLLIADVNTQVAFPPQVNAGGSVNGTVRFRNLGPSPATITSYVIELNPGLLNVNFTNLPAGAVATYNSTTGIVSFTGMPPVLNANQIASADAVNGIGVNYTQNAIANTTIVGRITTSTSQGANVFPDVATANVIGIEIVDVTTALLFFPSEGTNGQQIRGQVMFRNNGPSTAVNVEYGLRLPLNVTGVTFGNLPAGATATYQPANGNVVLVGMPSTLLAGQRASGDGSNGISISFTMPNTDRVELQSSIGTTSNQGANVLPDVATTPIVSGRRVDLVVRKTTAAVEAAPGDTITYRIAVRNNGPLAVPTATLADEVGPGVTLLAVRCATVPSNRCASAPSVAQLLGGTALPSLEVGASYELDVDARISGEIGQTVTNGARVDAPIGFTDSDPTNNRSTASLPIRTSPDLVITKTSTGAIAPGQVATWTLAVRNAGRGTTTGPTTIIDNLISSLSFVGATGPGWTCSADGQRVSCVYPAFLAAGTSTAVTLQARVSAAATGSISNTAIVKTPNDPREQNDTSTVSTPIAAGPDVVVVKTVDTDTLRIGGTATYTLTVTNRGPAPTSGAVEVEDDLPVGLVPTAATGPGFACTISGQRVECARTATLAVGASTSVTITVNVTPATPLGTLRNTACTRTASDVNTANDCAEITTPVTGRREAELAKTAVGEFVVGQPGTFRLTVRNRGTLALPGPITITDTLPRGVTYTAAQGSGWSCEQIDGVVRCTTPGPIAIGDSSFVTMVTSIAAAALPEFTNCATLGVPSGTARTNDGRSCVTVRPRSGPDLVTVKTLDTDTLRIGGSASYVLTVTNRGAAPTTGPIAVIDTLVAALQATSTTGANATCMIDGQIVRCERSMPLAVGESFTVRVAVTVRPTAAVVPITNTACARTTGDLNAANDCGTIITPVAGRREAVIRKEAAGDFVVGEPGTFRLTVRNTGTVALAAPITITDSLPRGLGFASAVGNGVSCTNAGAVVNCLSARSLAVGDSLSVTLTTTVSADAVPEVTNCATMTVAGGAVLANGGRACATVRPRADYRLVLELTTPRYLRELRDVPDFTVTVRNVGRSPLPNVIVTNQLPLGFSYVAGTSWRGGAPDRDSRRRIDDPSGGVGPAISWPVGDMAPGQVVRIDYRALIRVGASFNRDNITLSSAVASVPGLRVTSNTATVPIKLERGVFDSRGVISGKIYMQCDCDSVPGQHAGEVGIPGVRVVMEDGTGAITDSEGKYNILNVRAGLHIVKVDRTTLPAGAQLTVLNARNAGDAGSRFVDLKQGELHRADFAEGSGSPAVLAEVLLRRRTGEVQAAIDSTQLATAVASPMQASGAQQQQQRAMVLGGPTTTFVPLRIVGEPGTMPVDSRVSGGGFGIGGATQPNGVPAGTTFTSLATPRALHDGNSNLPVPPVRALAALTTQPGDAQRGRITIELPSSAVPADGRRMTPVTVRVFDRDGRPVKGNVPVTLEASAGGWRTLDSDRTAMGTQIVVTDGVATLPLVASNDVVIAQLRATSPAATATTEITFTPVPRPFFAAGLLQGRIDLRSLSRGGLNIAAADNAFEETLDDISTSRDSGRVRAGARGAVMLKGTVKNAGLLTLAFDSERDPARTQFRDITPDDGFPIFGDASLREFDAQSQQRLYARLDRGTSFVRYGDFATSRSDDRRVLLAYDRSMTGFIHHFEGARGVLNSFVSRNGIRQTVDELPGRGLSGPYFLSGTPVVNSERIEIITRDRNQPAVILRSQPMVRFEEYTVEAITGRVLFRAPVPSLDANLNPISIRVSYEVEQGGDRYLTYGTEGRFRAGSRVELGGFAVRDANPLDQQTLLGVSATALLGSGTSAIAEIARTEVGQDLGTQADTRTGDAWRIELRHQSSRVEGRIFALQGDTAFANRSSTFVGGRNEFGARWSVALDAKTRVLAEALRTEDSRSGGRRSGALLGIERRLGAGLVGELGYRWADENGASVSPLLGNGFGFGMGSNTTPTNPSQGLAPVSFNAARARLSARVPGSEKSSLFAEYELGIDDSKARRGSIGGEYLLFNRTRVYLRHEWLSTQDGPFALANGRSQQNTVFGVDADYLRNGQLFSEYRARDAFNGRDAEASIGLRNRWALRPGLLANTTFERVTPMAGSTNGESFAATGALEWTKSALWKGTTRLEWRTGPQGDNLLGSFGYARKVSRDWTMLARSLWDQMNTNALRGRSQLGMAWRQTDRNTVNALFRIENRLDRTDARGLPTSRTTANIAAALVNVQPNTRWTLSTRYAAKQATDQRDGSSVSSNAQLVMARSIFDITKRIDVGAIGSVLGDGGFGERRYGAGGELGLVVMRNLRLAAGYNLFGFTDRDFESLGYTQRGPYIEFGFKFDESLFSKTKEQK
jgi:uncharacterized repeat protein (TIGR01451 family)